MKFAFVLFKYFPYGGLQRGFLQLARTCVSRGHQVDVYTGSWVGKQPEDIEVKTITNSGLTNHSRYRSFARRLKPYIYGSAYDAIVGFNKMPGLDVYFASDFCYAAKASEKSLLYRLTNRYRTLIKLEKSVFSQSSNTWIIAISEYEKKQYKRHYGTPEKRFFMVPPGISKDRIAPPDASEIGAALRQEIGLAQDEFIVLMVGSNYKIKGVDRAIHAIASLPASLSAKTHLVIVGRGKAGPYRRLAKRLGILSRVIFIGERDDVPRFLLGADLLLHPAYRENTGTVLIEAMAAGLPVLATENCGYSFHISRANAGYLIPVPFLQNRLNEFLLAMLTSENLKKWSLNGKNYVGRTDVYSRHEKAAEVIEAAALTKNQAL